MSYRDFAQTVRALIGFEPVRELFVSHVERWRRKMKVIDAHRNRIHQSVSPLKDLKWAFKFTAWVQHDAGSNRCFVPKELEEKYCRLGNRLRLLRLNSEDRLRERTPSEQFTTLAAVHDGFAGPNDPRLGPSELGECPRGEAHYAIEVWAINEKPDQTKTLRELLAAVLARIEQRIDPTTTNRNGELLVDVIARIRNEWELQSSKTIAMQARIKSAFESAKSTLGMEPDPPTVKVYLHGWGEILNSLTLDNNSTNQRRIRELSERFQGPIILPGQGGQPKVVKDDLIVWYNGLEEKFRNESSQRENANAQAAADQAATLAGQYQHGKGGPDGQGTTVVPELGGHVRDRRATS